eukprot:m.69222 g.69222  ORF g.69222 m.69222 type:complete len:245 (-) comp7797_c0_seq2:95-829(-)
MAGVSAFPPPPAYFAQYTAEATADSAARLLQPPAIPAEPHSVFGIVTDENAPLLPSLEDQQQVRLYAAGDDIDHVAELHKLNRMLVGKFIELNDTLSDRPDDATRDTMLQRIHEIFINMHHLMNEFRPHQGHETVRAMLESQARKRLDLVAEISKCVVAVLQCIHSSCSICSRLSQTSLAILNQCFAENEGAAAAVNTSLTSAGGNSADELNDSMEDVSTNSESRNNPWQLSDEDLDRMLLEQQ